MILCQDARVGGQVGKVSLILPLASGELLPGKRVAEYRRDPGAAGNLRCGRGDRRDEGPNSMRRPVGLRTCGSMTRSPWRDLCGGRGSGLVGSGPGGAAGIDRRAPGRPGRRASLLAGIADAGGCTVAIGRMRPGGRRCTSRAERAAGPGSDSG